MKFSEMPYERIDFKKVQKEINTLIEKLKKASSGEEQFEIHKEFYKINDHVTSMMILSTIRYDIDTTDQFYKAEEDYYDEQKPNYEKEVVAYKQALYQSPFRKELEERIGAVAFKNIECSMKAFDEKLIPLMQEENKLTTEYDTLIAGAKIDWEGETLNVSLLRPYLINKDREIRKKAWKKYAEFFEANSKKLDEIYDKLVKNRTKQGKEMGYENYIPLGYYRMNRNCYDREMVENFRKQIKEIYVPFTQQLNEERKKRLGIDTIKYYDEGVYFQNGNPAPKGTPEDILKSGQQMYSELSKETKEFFDFMLKNELFDVIGRKTKCAGGFMEYLPEFESPFVFANFNGTSADVDVITHECGHAFQGYLSGKDPIREHADITMETAEIHSMSMEFFTEKWMNLFFGKEAEDYDLMHFEDCICFIPYGCMVDEFQHVVYEHPDYTPAQRNQAWRDLEKAYKPHLDYDGEEYFEKGGFWQKQLHIYDLPFYYIDYCLAQACALQYYTMMRKDFNKAWDSYLKLCKLSASDFYTNLLKQVGLENPFEDGTIKKLVQNLKEIKAEVVCK